MRDRTKYTMLELSRELGVHLDTLYKSKRRGRCSVKLALKLDELTGIPARHWAGFRDEVTYRDPWGRILKDG